MLQTKLVLPHGDIISFHSYRIYFALFSPYFSSQIAFFVWIILATFSETLGLHSYETDINGEGKIKIDSS